ncbi:hypothetical protein PIB30_077570 [Stylosanthes scabra]|uniref:Ninja-family protein n=1 Tax=Stylosanthes scabra TaxID=79078 RepID=A0ABU6RQV8_9FABA|nr:hypothetical protein [Stylosanthes scabra]
MAQVVEERENSSSRMSNFPRDLLKRFMSVNHHHHGDGDAAEQEIELSLGLSMNGRFGVDPTAKKIKRTTSIPEFSFSKPLRDEHNNINSNTNSNNQDIGGYSNNMPMPCTTNLIRTCSLPTETEEEWRKRKELQTLRRLEARRKRSEKQQRNIKAMREKSNRSSSSSFSEDIVGFVDGNNNSNLVEAALNEFSSLGRTTSLSTRVSELGLNGEKKSGGCGCGGLPPPSPSPSRGPFGSPQGPGASGISESESPPGQGSRPGDVRSPVGSDTFPTTTKDESSNKHSPPANKTKEIVKSLLEDMPCVSTKFDGPNGKKIEGFLYRYGKGLEVRIVCVCHGSFLTPAEFVKHGGGGDVSNPLKHIVVSQGGCL